MLCFENKLFSSLAKTKVCQLTIFNLSVRLFVFIGITTSKVSIQMLNGKILLIYLGIILKLLLLILCRSFEVLDLMFLRVGKKMGF